MCEGGRPAELMPAQLSTPPRRGFFFHGWGFFALDAKNSYARPGGFL
jgi:hypothetical protein